MRVSPEGPRHHPGTHHSRFVHALRIAWIALLFILVLLVLAPKAGGTPELLAESAPVGIGS